MAVMIGWLLCRWALTLACCIELNHFLDFAAANHGTLALTKVRCREHTTTIPTA